MSIRLLIDELDEKVCNILNKQNFFSPDNLRTQYFRLVPMVNDFRELYNLWSHPKMISFCISWGLLEEISDNEEFRDYFSKELDILQEMISYVYERDNLLTK
jgi:hypothetical protein